MKQWEVRDVEEKLWEIEGDSPNPICAKVDITIGLEGFLTHHLLPLPFISLVMHGMENCDLQNDPNRDAVCDISHAGLLNPAFRGRHSFRIRSQRQLLSHSPLPSLGFAALLGDVFLN